MTLVDDCTDLTVAVELHHPALGPFPEIYRGSSEAEARRNAWKRAMRDTLRGFRICRPDILPPEPVLVVSHEGLTIPSPHP